MDARVTDEYVDIYNRWLLRFDSIYCVIEYVQILISQKRILRESIDTLRANLDIELKCVFVYLW